MRLLVAYGRRAVERPLDSGHLDQAAPSAAVGRSSQAMPGFPSLVGDTAEASS
jgi:hypothetical protein